MAEENNAPRRFPRALTVWIMIFLAFGVLLLMRGDRKHGERSMNQTEFMLLLQKGQIRSASVDAEPNGVLEITGKYAKGAEEGSYRVRVLKTAELDQLLSKCAMSVAPDEDGWKNLLYSILPMVVIFFLLYFMAARQFRNANRGAMDFGKSRARMIPPDQLHVKFDDIAGADEAKEEIKEIVDFLKDPLKFQMVGGRIPKGCLLVGEPGTGKTLMAKAVACEAGVPFFAISGSDFVEMFVGVGASRVRDMFEQARKNMPCLIFIDEIDAVGRSRFSGLGGGHDEREQTLNAMLVEMDGLESSSGVIVLAATNRPDVLDPALLRPGRFDRQIVMDLPDITGRRKILDVHAARIKTDSTIDLDVLARTTPGFSGADLANVCNEAALLAARSNKEAVGQKELEEARDKVSYGRERRSRKFSGHERKLTAYHEAGHTLVALNSEHAVPVHKVTIIPRGQAYLGATFMMPKEDLYTKSKQELLADMAVAMGGRAAEEQIFGDISTGAVGDIEGVTRTARAMVCAYGMSDAVGPIRIGDFRNHPLQRIDAPMPDSLGEATAREIDLEIRKLVSNALDGARRILHEKSADLELLAQALLERETLDIKDIRVLLKMASLETQAEPAQQASVSAAETEKTETPEASDEHSQSIQ